jgi:hypothetical protein
MTIPVALPVTGSPATSNRLGRHLVDRIEERDVDLMLLEEVSCETGFQKLIVGAALDPLCDWAFVEAANSISTVSHGESDLVAIFQSGDRVAAVMVENKIAANFMHEQADRYRRRGERGIADGHWTEYVTVLMAPRRYLTADLHGHVFDRHLAYEDLLVWFQREDAGRRGAWRAALLERACGGTKSTVYKRVVDEATTAFFIDYWGIAARDYPALRMKREKDRPAKSTWVRFHPEVGLPGHIEVWHKAAETFAADLQFSRTRVEDLHAAIGHLIEPDMALEQRQKSAVIRIATTPLSVARGCAAQEHEIRAGLDAAMRLAAFYRKHREVLDAVPHA